jgi:hypothetical protein
MLASSFPCQGSTGRSLRAGASQGHSAAAAAGLSGPSPRKALVDAVREWFDLTCCMICRATGPSLRHGIDMEGPLGLREDLHTSRVIAQHRPRVQVVQHEP